MNKTDADRIITDYVRKLFGFAMSKLSSISEAEELAAEITLQVYQSLLRCGEVHNLDGYIYRIAQNVYARYIDGRGSYCSSDGIEYIPDSRDITAELENDESCGILRREITYLSKTQREIIVLHYFHDKKVREIAELLSLPENTVKWHLACSRKELRNGMDKIRTIGTLGAQPIRLINMGHNGHPGDKGDTSYFLAKAITQNIAYAAYHQPRTVNEIAEELGINPIFVEDEVAVLEEYGFMDKLQGGKYRTNIHIRIPSKEYLDIYMKIEPKYAQIFADKFFKPVLDSIDTIPEWLHIPDGDINLYKWSLVCFLSHKLGTADISDHKFSVKRPDGGDYVAHAQLLVKVDWEVDRSVKWEKYSFCGDMWRWDGDWRAWQANCYWTDRKITWTDNLTGDFEKLHYFLNGELTENAANAEAYQRLLDKGYIVKENGGYRNTVILCDSEEKWWQHIPAAPAEITELSKEYAAAALKAELLNQPAHLHEQIAYYNQNSACSLLTRIMEILVDNGTLTEPSPVQKKALCTIMFLGK